MRGVGGVPGFVNPVPGSAGDNLYNNRAPEREDENKNRSWFLHYNPVQER